MYRILEKNAKISIDKAIKSLGWEEIKEIKFEEPPNPKMGDLSDFSSISISKYSLKNLR